MRWGQSFDDLVVWRFVDDAACLIVHLVIWRQIEWDDESDGIKNDQCEEGKMQNIMFIFPGWWFEW
jgi:hypothetical protein